jgi:phosphatidylinositol alpha-1,6-mannosyltransferase
MKSLLISSIYFPPQVGGIAEIMAAVASALGPDRVCCLTGVLANQAVGPNHFRPTVYRRPAAFARAKPVQAVGLGMAISEIMVRERPSIVQLATAYDGYLGLWLRKWLKLPYVMYAYGNEILDTLQSSWGRDRLALQQADRVLAISRFAATLVEKAGVVPERIDIVNPGCDAQVFRPMPPRMELRQRLLGPRRGPVVLTVGNLVARKGFDMVIRALARLRQTIPDVTYLIVGAGPYRNELESLAAATGVRDNVVFAGMIPHKELPDVYALSDVFVMPSREQLDDCDVEGFGLVFLEASSCGKPVVGGRSGGVPEAVEDGVTGLLVNPHEPEEIAGTLARLLTDSELAKRLGQEGRGRVVRDFDSARVGDRVHQILESVLLERTTRN